MFFSEVGKESKEKHIWAGITLPNRNPPQNAPKQSVMHYITVRCPFCITSNNSTVIKFVTKKS